MEGKMGFHIKNNGGCIYSLHYLSFCLVVVW